MTCISLRRFQIAVVQLELVSGAGMTQRVENNIGQFGFGFELGEGLIDSLFLAGMSVWKGDDQIIIGVIAACQFNLVKLVFAQLLQHISNGFGNPYAANTAVCLGLFQNKNGAGCLSRPRGEDVIDVLVIQSSQRGAFNPCQFLHDIEPSAHLVVIIR